MCESFKFQLSMEEFAAEISRSAATSRIWPLSSGIYWFFLGPCVDLESCSPSVLSPVLFDGDFGSISVCLAACLLAPLIPSKSVDVFEEKKRKHNIRGKRNSIQYSCVVCCYGVIPQYHLLCFSSSSKSIYSHTSSWDISSPSAGLQHEPPSKVHFTISIHV